MAIKNNTKLQLQMILKIKKYYHYYFLYYILYYILTTSYLQVAHDLKKLVIKLKVFVIKYRFILKILQRISCKQYVYTVTQTRIIEYKKERCSN